MATRVPIPRRGRADPSPWGGVILALKRPPQLPPWVSPHRLVMSCCCCCWLHSRRCYCCCCCMLFYNYITFQVLLDSSFILQWCAMFNWCQQTFDCDRNSLSEYSTKQQDDDDDDDNHDDDTNEDGEYSNTLFAKCDFGIFNCNFILIIIIILFSLSWLSNCLILSLQFQSSVYFLCSPSWQHEATNISLWQCP